MIAKSVQKVISGLAVRYAVMCMKFRIGKRTNIQDNSVVHTTRGVSGTYIGDEVTVGHGAILHACTLGNRSFVGMGAIILDESPS